jgi:hypothetical protein
MVVQAVQVPLAVLQGLRLLVLAVVVVLLLMKAVVLVVLVLVVVEMVEHLTTQPLVQPTLAEAAAVVQGILLVPLRVLVVLVL